MFYKLIQGCYALQYFRRPQLTVVTCESVEAPSDYYVYLCLELRFRIVELPLYCSRLASCLSDQRTLRKCVVGCNATNETHHLLFILFI